MPRLAKIERADDGEVVTPSKMALNTAYVITDGGNLGESWTGKAAIYCGSGRVVLLGHPGWQNNIAYDSQTALQDCGIRLRPLRPGETITITGE